MKRPGRTKRNSRSGYALLFVYMMAATVAIMLYSQLPRVAFEAQREKEQLLVDRGEQYKRAVQLYVRKFGRFPADMAALENTQNIRFLRRQYKDPMTGKNEWRLVHVGPGGIFLDSKVYSNQKKDQQSGPQTFIATVNQFQPDSGGQAGVNLATRRRPSDDAAGATGSTDPNNPTPQPGQNPPGTAPISGPVMVLPDGRVVPATPTGIPATTNTPNVPGQPGVTQSGINQPGVNQPGVNQPGAIPGIPGQPGGFPQTGGFPGFTPPSGVGVQQGVTGSSGAPPVPGQPGFQTSPNGVPTSAANLINQILTTPRPGGLNGVSPTDPNAPQAGITGVPAGNTPNTGTPAGQGMGGQTIGGGFAGVASKFEQEGIKSYNGHTAYDEWEFVYDISKDASRGGGRASIPAQSQTGLPGQTGQPGQPTQPGQFGAGGQNGFPSLTPQTPGTPNK